MRSGRLRPALTFPRTWAAGLAFLLLVSQAQAFGDAAPTVENLRIGFGSNNRNNLFKVGNWTPVWVQVKGGDERFSGVIEVEVPDDAGVPTFFRQAVDLPAKGTSRVVTYARIGSRDPNLIIRFRDQDGKQVGNFVDGSNAVQFDTILPGESLILTLGKPQGVDLIPALPGFSNEKSATGGSELTIARIDTTTDTSGLPGRWYGYDAADAIVVDTDDKDLMQALTTRGDALVDWVRRGGHLIVSVGGNWQAVRDSVLGPILPGLPSGQERMPSLEALDSFAAATRAITPVGSPPVMVTKFDEIEKRGGKVLSETQNVPLVIRGYEGFGRVTLVGISTNEKPFSEWLDRANFWLRAVDIRRQSTGDTAGAGPAMAGKLYQSGVSDLSTQLHAALEQFPGVKLIPFGWVAFFIFIYILLIGPGDYFLLKKVFKRMELTWITFPLIVITVSSVAYFAAYVVKGKELKVNKVDFVDVDAATGTTRGSTFFNLFSPQNRDYGISVVPNAIDADPKNVDETTRPTAGTDVLLSWYGVPETGFGGMGSSGRIGFTGTGYVSLPDGGSERLKGVRVPIWATKSFSARWYGPAPVVAESDLIPVGVDRLAGTVTNRLNIPMKDAIVAFGKHVYQIGDLAPGATIQVELSQQERQLSNLIKSKGNEYLPGNYNTPTQRIDRPDLMLALMFHDTESSMRLDKRLASNPLHYLDLTGQLALERPMLVARIDRPGSTLVIENKPTTPQIDQTTMLRVILPLAKAQADSPK